MKRVNGFSMYSIFPYLLKWSLFIYHKVRLHSLYNSHCRVVYSLASTFPVEKTEEKVMINTRGGRKKGGKIFLNSISKAFLHCFILPRVYYHSLIALPSCCLKRFSVPGIGWHGFVVTLNTCFYSVSVNTQLVWTPLFFDFFHLCVIYHFLKQTRIEKSFWA